MNKIYFLKCVRLQSPVFGWNPVEHLTVGRFYEVMVLEDWDGYDDWRLGWNEITNDKNERMKVLGGHFEAPYKR